MADRIIDKVWFTNRIKDAGYSGQGDFARAIGLSPPQLSNILSGKRRTQTPEAIRMAEALRVPTGDVLAALGMQESNPWEFELVVSGIIGPGDMVKIFRPEGEELGLERVKVPFVYGGHCLRVDGPALGPRFRDGEFLGAYLFGEAEISEPNKLIGRECFVELENGDILFRTVQAGRNPGLYTLISQIHSMAPIVDVKLRWVAPLDFHLPAGNPLPDPTPVMSLSIGSRPRRALDL